MKDDPGERSGKLNRKHLRGVPAATSTLTVNRVNEYRDEMSRKLDENERFPNAFECSAIDAVNGLLQKEFERLGLTRGNSKGQYHPLRYEQVHIKKDVAIVSDNIFTHISGTHGYIADVITLPEKMSAERFIKTLLHEAIHAASFITIGRVKKTSPEGKIEKGLDAHRGGYDLATVRERADMPVPREGYFLSWNEGVIESITQRLLAEHSAELHNLLPQTSSDALMHAGDKVYVAERKLYTLVVGHIAKNTREKPGDVASRIERGLFTGDMMHLRDIERTGGENALLFISLLNGDFNNDKVMPDAVEEFLTSEDPKKRYFAARRIFFSDDYLRYIAYADSRSIKQFLREPLPEQKSEAYETHMRATLEKVHLKTWVLEGQSSGNRNMKYVYPLVRKEEGDVLSRQKEYEKKFGKMTKLLDANGTALDSSRSA